MKIEYSDTAKKFLNKTTKSDLIKITKKIELLKESPLIGKKLHGKFEGKRSLRAWPFRIIYRISHDTIQIFIIEHRQKAYK